MTQPLQKSYTICGMCANNTCGLQVEVRDGRPVNIKGDRRHPLSRGRICPMALAAIDQHQESKRLRHPLRRTKSGWQKITWEDALDETAQRLGDLRSRHGAQCLAVYQGHAQLQLIRQGWIDRFLNVVGTPNLIRNDHLCHVPTMLMERAVYGAKVLGGFDPLQVGGLVFWGSNPATSASTTVWPRLQAAKRRGVPLVVVDPRRTPVAQRADLHLAPRPGTDAALGLGIINALIQSGNYDTDFVSRWTVGFEALSRRVAAFTPAVVADITTVSATRIKQFADLLADNFPIHIFSGNALEHHRHSSQAVQAISILRALLGSLEVPGGHQFIDPLPLADVGLNHLRRPGMPILGTAKYPFFTTNAGFVPGDVFIENLISGQPYPIRAALMCGGNPMLTWPNTARVKQALNRLEFMVSMDIRMSETCRQAHIVLPMASFLERTRLIGTSGFMDSDQTTLHLGMQKPLLDPGNCRSDEWVLRDLARRLGHRDAYRWENNAAAIDTLLKPLEVSFQALAEAPHGLSWGAAHVFKQYEQSGFDTPSGKVELTSHLLQAHGHDPLPDWSPPAVTPSADDFPLVLNAGRRSLFYTHSQFRDYDRLNAHDRQPQAEIHPDTATRYDIADGQMVTVESPRGRIDIAAQVTDAIIPGIVSIMHGWSHANVNLLTDHQNGNAILASAPMRSGACRIRALAAKSSESRG